MLEHVPDPERTLSEMARCAERHLLVSVPREPLWRMLNMARGAYWSAARQHAGSSEPLVQTLVRATVLAPRGGGRGPFAVSLDDAACPPLGPLCRDGQSNGARSYGRGARILSIGIACTGLLTLAYFSISSHVLSEASASRIALLWSVMFVIISVIYRPIEQLLSRTIAERRAKGHSEHRLRVPMLIQAGFALTFLVVALALQEELVDNVFDHYQALYDVLVVGTLAYAASYFARGWLAGHEYFALYGGLVLMESLSRLCFALAVALGIASGQTAVALGIAAAPLVSLVVVPAAFARRGEERREALGQTPPQHRIGRRPRSPAGHGADLALAAPITADEADAALAGPGTEGVQEAAAHDELSLRRGGWLRRLGVGHHALRADAAERRRADRGGHLPEQGARGDRL